MTIQIDDVIDDLISGRLSLEAACRILTSESRADPARTRFWDQRIQTQATRGLLSRGAARSLMDALENFDADKTVWLDSSAVTLAKAKPTSVASPKPALERRIDSLDQLRATLFRPITRRPRTRPIPPQVGANDRSTSDPVPDLQAVASHPASLSNIPPGTVIKDRYRIVTHLGMGGVGQIFDAVDLAHEDAEVHVTLKVVAVNLKHEPHAFGALQAATQHSQQLTHPNIVDIHDIDHDGDRVFIVMEPLRGRWLSSLIRDVRGMGLPHETAWPIISGIANGLAYAHKKGIVHSDLSPHAVFLCEDGTPKIMGFGLIHAVPSSNESMDVLDTLTVRAYTEAYTADPWAQQAKPHAADDLYPLGVIAYEMLTGVHPFRRCSLSIARQKKMSFEPIPGLDRHARKLIERCLSFEREVRPQDAARFVKRMQPTLLQRMLAGRA